VRTDGMVKLTDFGIAKAADAVPVTRSGMVMGTAHYIAPEQASGAEAGPAGDVYSLGIVGYECLAGHRPFRAESAVAVAMMQVRDQPPPLPGSVPPHARELIEAVLVKDPTQRYSTGGEFAAAVAAVRRGERLPAPGTLTGPFTPPRARPILTPPKPAAKTPTPTPTSRAATPTAHRLATPSSPATPQPRLKSKTPSSPRRPVPAVAARPVELRAGSGRGRTLLLVLFVLLTVAAVVVGVYVVRNLGAGPTPQGMAPGTVALLHEPSDRR
jgi:eukaryotic-like serine/threonine-protein kinase